VNLVLDAIGYPVGAAWRSIAAGDTSTTSPQPATLTALQIFAALVEAERGTMFTRGPLFVYESRDMPQTRLAVRTLSTTGEPRRARERHRRRLDPHPRHVTTNGPGRAAPTSRGRRSTRLAERRVWRDRGRSDRLAVRPPRVGQCSPTTSCIRRARGSRRSPRQSLPSRVTTATSADPVVASCRASSTSTIRSAAPRATTSFRARPHIRHGDPPLRPTRSLSARTHVRARQRPRRARRLPLLGGTHLDQTGRPRRKVLGTDSFGLTNYNKLKPTSTTSS
jgi:hypothetical protein